MRVFRIAIITGVVAGGIIALLWTILKRTLHLEDNGYYSGVVSALTGVVSAFIAVRILSRK